MNTRSTAAANSGLYDPRFEHDACGVGFVCNYKGTRSNRVIRQGLEVLSRLAHRGATGADPRTGDGAGILIQVPHEFFLQECVKAKIRLPAAGSYGVGMVFLPPLAQERLACKEIVEKIAREEGCLVLGWRPVPVDDADIGVTARRTQPAIEQVFIGESAQLAAKRPSGDTLFLERRLYVIRKRVESVIRTSSSKQESSFYITNLSSRTCAYKGLLMPGQVVRYFPDLSDPLLKSSICLVHSRYSTNTFPTWDLAQPFRYLAHNGEINTLRGNINWMQARESLLRSGLFKSQIDALKPVIVPGGSDSAMLDNIFELLYLSGRPLAQVMMMLVPVDWENNPEAPDKLKAFYKYHACLMEPWDGPAAICFTDGIRIGAMLDRNGLRPCRYLVTKHDQVIMASEAGVLDIPAEDILSSGRLEPGKMFFINTEAGRIIGDRELKELIAARQPYQSWLDEYMVELDTLPRSTPRRGRFSQEELFGLMKAFGYTREDLKMIIKPMLETAQEPVGAMGNDTPHAVLSAQPQLLYSYFKQLFAQVTNPAIDPIREELVMSLATYLGPEKNLLEESPLHCHKVLVKQPILDNEELERIRSIKVNSFRTKTISLLFDARDTADFLKALQRVCEEAAGAIKQGYTFIILSDQGVDKQRAALPALLACSTVHQYLVKRALRSQIGIIVESAEPREVHHFALLLGYGADCVNPYLAYAVVEHSAQEEDSELDAHTCRHNYIKAVHKGILKILSKMGISTLQSYRGAQIFEALGLSADVIDRCFTGTVSRIGGATLSMIARETLQRHRQAWPARYGYSGPEILASGGLYQWKKDGEFHLWNPESIAALQDAVRNENFARYQEFAKLINDQSSHPTTLRSLFVFKKTEAIDSGQVETVESIVKRFATGAMSFGSISGATHKTIAVAMNRLGGRSNTGEGGEDPARFIRLPNGDSMRSAIKQVASGRFGVTTNYLINADELQIKICQGAKPGEGGQLPGHKVSAIIARTRYTTPGVMLISPPPHHDIYSIEDLAQLIFDLKNVNPRARISVKLVSEIGVGTVAAGVAKGHADMILISGGDGGTGASPWSSIKHAGLPWELGLAEAHQTLVLNDLRSRVRLQTDGQMRTGRDVVIAALLGAEEFGFCTAVLVTLGCVMLRHCNLNNCSLGVATQDELLEKRFSGRPEYVINYMRFVAEEARQIMAQLGIRKMDELIGRTDLLEADKRLFPAKAPGLDLSRILYKPEAAGPASIRCSITQDHGIDTVLDRTLIKQAKEALEKAQPVKIDVPVRNTDRAVGAMLSGEVCRRFGEEGLPEDTIRCRFTGVAGQSFGAFLTRGVSFELEGMANDYVGKGLSGGKVSIYPHRATTFSSEENCIIGNTAFYGASAGEAYIRGVAGERFCIRNSGLYGVVEGMGDHGCEYMTGGRVVVLGRTGRNFAAGMSGGIAYVYDRDGTFKKRCNADMVSLESLDEVDSQTLKTLLANHFRYTFSPLSRRILDDMGIELKRFVKVIPHEYKRILDQVKIAQLNGLLVNSEG
ncbi:MAG TPA: glutamate synthase large subunit [Candidatus Omnitrophota bacterium]|nr:glutamate synthase large subunit [Candidatus Omnitrophota bacterium]HRZ14566.1 glutamate synthase large subunit [Candidatus Omnitrophota bacterium]